MKKIGLVGGISWVSTIDYYRYINEGINEKLGGLNYAECIIYSLNFGDVHTIGWENAYELLYKACNSLRISGANAIVLCANTAHLMAERLEKETGLPVIHIGTVTAAVIHDQGLKTVGLLGTIFTMENDFYKHKLSEYNIKCITPQQKEIRSFIQQTLRDELGKGIFKEETKRKYLSIINELVIRGAEGIILGCTEIPMFINKEDVSVPVFDTTKIHSEAAVSFAISL